MVEIPIIEEPTTSSADGNLSARISEDLNVEDGSERLVIPRILLIYPDLSAFLLPGGHFWRQFIKLSQLVDGFFFLQYVTGLEAILLYLIKYCSIQTTIWAPH